jgi:hypothetical protein
MLGCRDVFDYWIENPLGNNTKCSSPLTGQNAPLAPVVTGFDPEEKAKKNC